MTGPGREIAGLAAALAPSVAGGATSRQPGEPLRLLRGTVVSHAGSLAVVTTDGVNNRTDVPWLASYTIADGDHVWLLSQPPLLLIIGKSV